MFINGIFKHNYKAGRQYLLTHRHAGVELISFFICTWWIPGAHYSWTLTTFPLGSRVFKANVVKTIANVVRLDPR